MAGDGQVTLGHEVLKASAKKLRRLYKEPEKFGICHNCGDLIDFDRLDTLPHARYCMNCKLKEEADAA